MVRHIVMWNLKDKRKARARWKTPWSSKRARGAGWQNRGAAKGRSELKLQPQGFDPLPLAEYDSKEALEFYQKHPEHLKVREFVHKVITERVVADMEL